MRPISDTTDYFYNGYIQMNCVAPILVISKQNI